MQKNYLDFMQRCRISRVLSTESDLGLKSPWRSSNMISQPVAILQQLLNVASQTPKKAQISGESVAPAMIPSFA